MQASCACVWVGQYAVQAQVAGRPAWFRRSPVVREWATASASLGSASSSVPLGCWAAALGADPHLPPHPPGCPHEEPSHFLSTRQICLFFI